MYNVGADTFFSLHFFPMYMSASTHEISIAKKTKLHDLTIDSTSTC